MAQDDGAATCSRSVQGAFTYQTIEGLAFSFVWPFAAPGVVDIDIRPGSAVNPVTPKSSRLIPVAILASDGVDVADVDVTTLTFGPAAASPAHRKGGHFRDVNGDGLMDLVSYYRTRETGIAIGDTKACVSGKLLGTAFESCDSVRIVRSRQVGRRSRNRFR